MDTNVEDVQEEDDGPSVDSSNQEERIAARRFRITRRIETAKREALGENVSAKEPADLEREQRKSRKQIEESYQRLLKLSSDGSELVSNVQVACDAREAMRRGEEDEIKRQRTEKLEAEAKAAVDKFEEITKKWDLALSKDTPQDLHSMLQEQKTACDAMTEEKEKLINELQQELKSKDDSYVKDLRKEAEDIDLMIERMEEQVKTLLRAYRQELTEIEKSFDTERRELLGNNTNKLDSFLLQRTDKEVEYMKARENRVDDFETQLQTLRIQDAEEYNMVKIKLETDVQILEQNLQQMKATYQLNQEKLEYNFQVLRKREEENMKTKSQQKRKITRLQDLLNNLKQKSKKQEKQFSDENQNLTDDLKRITEQYKELQKKFRHFQATDNKKFIDIWTMNEERAKQLVRDVVEEDRIIHQQQLGLPYEQANLEFLKNTGPLQILPLKESKTAVEAVQQILLSEAGSTRPSISTKSASEVTDTSEPVIKFDPRHDEKKSKTQPEPEDHLGTDKIKQMLELLCDESSFLVESKLIKLLSPLDKDEQSLMKLDAIFNALGIEIEEDIHLLAQYFFDDIDRSVLRRNSIMQVEVEVEDEKTEDDRAEQDRNEGVSHRKVQDTLIHPNDVLRALRRFVEDHREPLKETRRASFRLGLGPIRDASEDEAYWKQFQSVIDDKKKRLWDALIDAFEKYSQVATERATLIQETEALRQQNSELRMLLHQYINSKVNQELEIPPTRVLQLEANRE